VASSVGAGDAERPVSHRGTAGRDAQRSDRAGPAKYYSGPQTRPCARRVIRRGLRCSPAAGTSTKDVSQTCDPVLLSASHSAARAAAARRAFQVEATGRQHVVRRQTCALAGPRHRDRALSGNLIHSRVKNESCNLNMLIRTRYFRTTSEIMYPAMRARQAIGTATGCRQPRIEKSEAVSNAA
jgi:hypothetical protein